MEMLSTYRLQFHKGFTFRDAAAIVPYLHDLGITHVYASPYLKAVTGSTHGYDVIDHSQLNPEIGSDEDFHHFVATLSDHGMSHILDTVPNHMGVDTNDNQWWNDVLLHGRDSKYGNFFDIDWDQFPPRPQLLNKVLLPVLGESFGEALEKNLLQLKHEEQGTFVCYYDRKFPIDGGSSFNGGLSELLNKQHYRLSHWRVAPDEINYRRFFDVTSLAALQMQRQDVFDAAHDFTFSLIAAGYVTGLRVDHPDGLLDPKQYFARLQEKFRKQCPAQAASGKLYVSVEKIINGDEELREDWDVAGTSGYDFLCRVNDLFVDSTNESKMTAIYNNFVGDATEYADLVYQKKCMILDTSLNSELTALTSRLDTLAQLSNSTRDFTGRQLREALRAIIACFPVYRSYISNQVVSESDVEVVQNAVDNSIVRNPQIASDILHFVRDAVLLRNGLPGELAFSQRFQQLTSPVNAKGIEDTTFYIYNRLTSLNEVGGDPGRFGRSAESLHQYFQHRNAKWPTALSSLSTHDTKRSEDVRARLNVLSEIPDQWETQLKKWRELNVDLSASVHPGDQYLLYQTLLGAWPIEGMDEQNRTVFVERICAYMQKAMREAKVRTSWTAVNSDYESGVSQLVADLTDPIEGGPFLAEFVPFQKKVSHIGLLNSISQTVIRLMGPGIPDTYQGTELWDFSLVDPDNRRPVNFQQRVKLLNEMKQAPMPRLVDERLKLWITWKCLHLRQQCPELFLRGSYEPLKVAGKHSSNIFAFAKAVDDRWVIMIAPRLVAGLGNEPWNETSILLTKNCKTVPFENIFTGQQHICDNDRGLPLSDVFRECPVAVLITN